MIPYKRKIQLRLYMLENKLPMDPLCRSMLEYAIPLNFKKNETIKMPSNKEMIYFINKGQAIAYVNSHHAKSWMRLIGQCNFFCDFDPNPDTKFQDLTWQAITALELLAIPFRPFMSSMQNFPTQWKSFLNHLQQIELERIQHLALINTLKNAEKVDYLEQYLPHMIIQTKYEFIARFIGMSRESLTRIISKKNHSPSVF